MVWVDGLSVVLGYFNVDDICRIVPDTVFGLYLDDGRLSIQSAQSSEFAQFGKALFVLIEYYFPPLFVL
jgi:hypothetical protein